MKFLKFSDASTKEYKAILLPSLLFWLLMAGLAIGRAANDTFFIGQSGAENLPRVFIFNAVILALVSLFYSFLEKHIERFSLLVWLIVFFMILLILLRSQLHKGYSWIPYAVFCYYEVLLLSVQMHFWTCLNDIFGPREGKRLFPIIGAIGLSGTIFGGIFTWLASPLIGYQNLFFVWIFLLCSSLPFALRLKKSLRNIESQSITSKKRKFQDLKEILRSPLMRYLALISIPFWLVVHSVDWLFYLAIEEMFIGRPNELSSFLGLLGGLVSFLGIILQLFITRFLLRKIGVALAYSLYSLSMTMGAFFLFLRTCLPSNAPFFTSLRASLAVMVRFADESILFSIYDSALQLLYGALPSSLRGQARAFIHGVMETSMTAMAGIILSFAASFALSQQWIALGTFLLGLVWIFLSLGVRKYYLSTLALNLNSKDLTIHSDALTQIPKIKVSAQSRELLFKAIHGEDKDTALLALAYIKNLKDRESLVKLGEDISKCKGVVFEMALQIISESKISQALPPLKRICITDDNERQAAALVCIGQIEPNFIYANTEYFLESSNPALRGAVIFTIINSQRRLHPKNIALKTLRRMIASPEKELQLEAVKVLSQLNKKTLTPLLLKLTKSPHSIVKTEVMKAMGHYKHREISDFLIAEMKYAKSAHLINNSLIRQGRDCIPALHKEIRALRKESVKNFSILQNIIYCLGEIGDIKSSSLLGFFLNPKNEHLEKVSIKSLAKIAYKNKVNASKESLKKTDAKAVFSRSLLLQIQKKLNKNSQIIESIEKYIQSLVYIESKESKAILKEALERNRKDCLYVSMKCLGILHDPRQARAAEKALQNNDIRQRSEAIEVLESLGEEGKRLSRGIERRYHHNYELIRKPEKLFKEIGKIKNYPWLSLCAIYAIGELGLESLVGLVKKFSRSPYKIIQDAASLSIAKLSSSSSSNGTNRKKLKKQENISMNVERILFLRSVPIFSDVEASDLQWISEIVIEEEVQAKNYVFHEKEDGDRFYIVKQGKIDIVKGDTIFNIVLPREYFGEIAIFDQEPRTASALAREHTSLLSIHRDDFQRLIFARPEIALAMFKTISHRLRETTKKVPT